MTSDVVTIPKDEYQLLVKCREIVESEFEEKFSKKFIQDVRKSEGAYRKGTAVRFKSIKEVKKFLDTL